MVVGGSVAKTRPLLVCNTDPYLGPWVPTERTSGVVWVDGLESTENGDKDLVIIHTSMGRSYPVGSDLPLKVSPASRVRAQRVLSTGREVSVWLR